MIQVILPVIDRAQDYLKCIGVLSRQADVRVLVGVAEPFTAEMTVVSQQVEMYVYPAGSRKEEIINGLQAKLEPGKVMVCRKPISAAEFIAFRDSYAEITLCKDKPMHSVKKFFVKLWAKIIRLIFGVKFFEGDTSVVCFHENLYDVISKVNNFSYCSRVNRWKGIEQETVSTAEPPAKAECDRRADLKLLIFSVLSLAVCIVVTTLLAVFVRINVVIGLLLFCLDTICLCISLLLLFTYLFNVRVGQKSFKAAVCLGDLDEYEGLGESEPNPADNLQNPDSFE